MRHETQAAVGRGKETKTDRARGLIAPPPLDGLEGGVVELSLLVPGAAATALEAAAYERGLTMAQLARLLIRDFLGRTFDGRTAPTVIRTKDRRQGFETKEELIGFQRGCPHPSAGWVRGGGHESLVCERCWAVLDVG